jgi:hypothetical protein
MSTSREHPAKVGLNPLLICSVECQNEIYGCSRCSESGSVADPSGSFVICSECSEGFYLLKNKSHQGNYLTYHTTCVPDCRRAHSSYINDPVTGICQCKAHSPRCYLILHRVRPVLWKLQLEKWMRILSRVELSNWRCLGSVAGQQCPCNFESSISWEDNLW